MNNLNFEQLVAAQPEDSSVINWHSAFFEGIQLELLDYQDVLEFHAEYQLTDQPLRIDCLIIKKVKDVEIKKNIAAIFREWNIVEYKSPDDYVSIGDFNKAHAYAYQLAWLKNVSVTDITISFVESRYPRELFNILREKLRYTVEKTAPGIYTVTGDVMPIQVIDNRELSVDGNLWLKNLSNRLAPLEVANMRRLAAQQGKDAKIGAYFDTLMRANYRKDQEETDMTAAELYEAKLEMFDASLDRWFERTGGPTTWVAQGHAEGKAENSLAIARKMKAMGDSAERIHAITDLPMETIEQL